MIDNTNQALKCAMAFDTQQLDEMERMARFIYQKCEEGLDDREARFFRSLHNHLESLKDMQRKARERNS